MGTAETQHAGRKIYHTLEWQTVLHSLVCSANNASKWTSCLLFVSKVSSLALLLSFSELCLLVSKPFQQLVTIDTVWAEKKQNKKTPANLEQSVPHLYRHILILRWHLTKEKEEDSGWWMYYAKIHVKPQVYNVLPEENPEQRSNAVILLEGLRSHLSPTNFTAASPLRHATCRRCSLDAFADILWVK